jgi:hypothetical protein
MSLNSTIAEITRAPSLPNIFLTPGWVAPISSSTHLFCDELDDVEISTQTCFIEAFGQLASNRTWSEYILRLSKLLPQFLGDFAETYKTVFINSSRTIFTDILETSQVLRWIKTNPQKPIPFVIFAWMLRQYDFVEKVICWDQKDTLAIWTVVNKANRQQRAMIYDSQWDLLQLFNNISVDFNLIDHHDVPLDELITVGETAWIIQS